MLFQLKINFVACLTLDRTHGLLLVVKLLCQDWTKYNYVASKAGVAQFCPSLQSWILSSCDGRRVLSACVDGIQARVGLVAFVVMSACDHWLWSCLNWPVASAQSQACTAVILSINASRHKLSVFLKKIQPWFHLTPSCYVNIDMFDVCF